MQLFGTSGIRAIADDKLARLSFKVGLALGGSYHNIVLGGDTRTSTEAIKHAFASGVLLAGGNCHDAGTIPTPTVGFIARDFDAGVMITASHNPPEYNGLKLFNPDGSAFDAYQRQQIETAVSDDSAKVASWDAIKTCQIYEKATERHIERILRDFPARLGLKVVVDSGCGATSLITPELLTLMGCEVITINCHYSGFFPRGSEPIVANLVDLINTTVKLGADLGIAHDGDGDRMMVVDERGRFVPGDALMVILARELRAKDIVTTIDASMSIGESGFQAKYTRVGDTFVSDELRVGGDFGGEPSGSWIFPRMSLCPDGVYAAAQVATIASRDKLSSLVDNIPQYPLIRGGISSNGMVLSNMEQQLMALKPLTVTDIDGVKLQFEDGWLLVRPSGTEPKIRITVEARSEEQARHLYDSAVSLLRTAMGETT